MKLRLAAHALRLRILRSELARLEAGETLREQVRLSPGPDGCIVYSLGIGEPQQQEDAAVSCRCGAIEVLLSPDAFRRWCAPDQVGIYATAGTGNEETLEVVLEKDFACLDRDDADNRDTFDHPLAGTVC